MSDQRITTSGWEILGEPRRIKVLMYHRVLPEGVKGAPPQISMPVRQFRRQMELLDRWGYTAITFDDYRLYLAGELNLPRKPVVITFNDGYVETCTVAFPILQEFGMKAVVFVLANSSLRSSMWDGEKNPEAVTPLLSEDQILEMHAAGFEIGSQGLNHTPLGGLAREEIWEEVSRSRMLLEILLNAPVRSFAYPYGVLDDNVKKMIPEAGYSIACAGWSGPALFGDDPFEIRRVAMLSRPYFGDVHLAVRMLGPYQLYRWLWWRLRGTLEAAGVYGHHLNGENE